MLVLKIGKNKYIKLEKAKDLSKLIKKSIFDKNGHVKTVYVKVDEDINIKRSTDMEKRLWFLNKDNNNISDLIKFMRKQNIEYCCVTNNGKTSFFKKAGHKTGINFTNEELNEIKNSKQFIHNHPKGTSFSVEDLSMFLFKNINEIQIVCVVNNKNTTYSLKKIKEIPISIADEIIHDYQTSFEINDAIGMEKPSNHAMMVIKDKYEEYLSYDRFRK